MILNGWFLVDSLHCPVGTQIFRLETYEGRRRASALRSEMESEFFNLSCHNSLECDRKDLSAHGNLRATHGVAPLTER